MRFAPAEGPEAGIPGARERGTGAVPHQNYRAMPPSAVLGSWLDLVHRKPLAFPYCETAANKSVVPCQLEQDYYAIPEAFCGDNL
jgi:hypothetical protein